MTALTLVTWNVHHCVGAGGVYSPERTAEVIKSFDADVVCLQELDHRYPPVLGKPQAEYFEYETGMTALFGPAIETPRGAYGNAILTRVGVEASEVHDLSIAGREPRTMLEVRLNAGGRPLRVLTTHLGLKASERGKQARRIAGIVARGAVENTVLAGDMNVWMPGDPALRPIDMLFANRLKIRTFPARRPVFRLDRIWSGLPLSEGRVIPETGTVSDHVPVIVRLQDGGS